MAFVQIGLKSSSETVASMTPEYVVHASLFIILTEPNGYLTFSTKLHNLISIEKINCVSGGSRGL